MAGSITAFPSAPVTTPATGGVSYCYTTCGTASGYGAVCSSTYQTWTTPCTDGTVTSFPAANVTMSTAVLQGQLQYPPATNLTTYYILGLCSTFPTGAIPTASQLMISSGGSEAAPPTLATSLFPATLYCYQLCAEATVTNKRCGGTQQFITRTITRASTNVPTSVDDPAGSATLNGALAFPAGIPAQW